MFKRSNWIPNPVKDFEKILEVSREKNRNNEDKKELNTSGGNHIVDCQDPFQKAQDLAKTLGMSFGGSSGD